MVKWWCADSPNDWDTKQGRFHISRVITKMLRGKVQHKFPPYIMQETDIIDFIQAHFKKCPPTGDDVISTMQWYDDRYYEDAWEGWWGPTRANEYSEREWADWRRWAA